MDEPATGREPKRARLGDRFQITCPDEKYQFVNTWFPLTVYVVNEAGQLKSGGGDKHLDLRLAVECEGEENVQYLPKLLEIDPKTPLLIPAGNGRANIRVKILECSMNDVSRNFFLEVCSAKSVKNDTDISQTRTANIVVINHQLKLSKNLTWEDEWYKDEGGREKCISFSVELCNSKNERVLDRKIPLKITLVYANGQEVGRQDILKLMECDNSLTGGCAEIKARIDEVSRSHQNQPFQIRVAPDVAANPLDNDISPILSPPVVVRSKRNNRKKAAPVPTSQPLNKSEVLPSPARADDGADEAAAALVSVKYDDSNNYQQPTLSILNRQTSNSNENTGREALENVLGWIGNVLETVHRLKWREDFDKLPDGSLDPTPQVSMRNPNRDIDGLLHSYKSGVMDNLNTLLDQFEEKDSDKSDHSSPRESKDS